MSKHEDLKIICDTIGFDVSVLGKEFIKRVGQMPGYFQEYDTGWRCDVREIIFTPEFIEKLAGYLFDLFDEDMVKRDNAINKIMLHLDDPVSYLYNLIIGNK